MEKIAQALTKIFDQHRIVFWYDNKKELRADYEALDLTGVEKIEIQNNQFAVKYRILRQQPEQKFLLYYEGPQPEDLDNWLLDVQLAYGEFRTDQVGLWLSELNLGLEFSDVIKSHSDFFNSGKRRRALKQMLKPDDTPGMIRTKMLAVCLSAEPRLDEIIESLLAELAEEKNEKFNMVQRCHLDTYLFKQLESAYGYRSETPGIEDFGIELFKSCYAMGTDGKSNLGGDALVFLKRWKNNIHNKEAFETLSHRYAGILNIEEDLQQRDYRRLVEIDYFELIDRKILSDLVKNVSERTVSTADCSEFIRQRRRGFWYHKYEHLYQAINYASRFLHTLNKIDLSMGSMSDGITKYGRNWFKLDQLYRKFIYHFSKPGQFSLMERLSQQVENFYTNEYLFQVNNNWQQHVDEADKWDAAGIPLQKRFFDKWVRPFPDNDKKVCVIVSDAFRYEIGDEFLGLVRKEDRYDAEIEPCLSLLPSYTQLGMAALLPNEDITITPDQSGTVMVDGLKSPGLDNRIKLLDKALPGRATAVRADELLKMNKDTCRELFRAHDVVYVFHNRIDTVGDKRDSEGRVFEAVDETLNELVKIVKKLTAANASNLIVTADHGFIYQNHPIEESDFSLSTVEGKQVLYRDRRFILGKGLSPHPGLKTFQAADVGLSGDMEIQIPKSISRLRKQGAGSRYVHGGSSLQEVVVPVIRINKKRRSDITYVEVDILRGATSVITTGQLSVAFYQTRPVSDKVLSRTLEAGIYTGEGELISDTHELVFDLTSENPRERELNVRFVLTRDADKANGQDVILRLREKIQGTAQYREYDSARYLMRRSFTGDFDF